MTPAQRARQIDAEEFQRDSRQALARALAYSRHKQEERRRQFLTVIYGEQGQTMPLWSTQPKDNEGLPVAPVQQSKPKTKAPDDHHGRVAKIHTVNGRSLTARQWANLLGVSISTLFARAKKLGSLEAAIGQGGKQRSKSDKRITFDGLSFTRKEWAHHLGISYDALCARISKHGQHEAIAMGGPGGNGPQRANDSTPGVVEDFSERLGTGGGSHAQETPKISFSGKTTQE
ncbi:hypothetical protein [Rhizobium sp. FKL33]|uniref:hypothetical protein n=1 Tax=Rhizobium sp. FKL33 TaxID=2562307 RepID=UPI0010C0C294|nr:hypothetical protein [Rhizobium sp. FKL33]